MNPFVLVVDNLFCNRNMFLKV